MQIEQLEVLLDDIRKDDLQLQELFKLKEISNFYCKKTAEVVKIHKPNLEKNCNDLLYLCMELTEVQGHSLRLDFIKDSAFDTYGKCVGEKL